MDKTQQIKFTKKQLGNIGEQEVCSLVRCPNCSSHLILLPEGFPMHDVQCSRCLFRAQIKTVNSRPKSNILGAGWDIFEKHLKTGNLAPLLIVNFRWQVKKATKREIRFYPFISKSNLQSYQLSSSAQRANYKMFKYINLDKIPYVILYKNHG